MTRLEYIKARLRLSALSITDPLKTDPMGAHMVRFEYQHKIVTFQFCVNPFELDEEKKWSRLFKSLKLMTRAMDVANNRGNGR